MVVLAVKAACCCPSALLSAHGQPGGWGDLWRRASAGALYAFIISQWRKSKGREDERHLKRGYDNLHHHIKSKMDEVSGERPPGA